MEPELVAFLFVVAMFMGVFIIYMGLRQRSEQLQMLHRERMAMIEKGQIPLSDGQTAYEGRQPRGLPGSRSLSLGIVVVGIGLALATMISLAAEAPEVGLGVGGAIAILGGAFIARAVFVRPSSALESPDINRRS
jgi:hypothetical protein